ncbi:MAG: GPO family capsid scaffolding protein [Desulfovibrio desulfuricans]|nr:GPO family capsid scaffolding protein [Desulfovibrio desulfuricans]
MAKLTTDFIKVAQVGPAADGRTIHEEWLREMAESYNPATYTAMLWPEHCRWFGNLGEVLELRAGPDEAGVFSLFARFAPNAAMLDYNAAGQGLFYSIEVSENFADSGKTYLSGLGVTDSPASLGMPSTRFTAQKDTNCFSNVPYAPMKPEDKDDAPGWFKRFFPQFFNKTEGAAPEAAPNPEKESNMEELEARVTAVEETVAALAEQVGGFEGRLAALEVDVAAGGSGDASGGDFAVKALARQIGALRNEFRQAAAAARPGTTAPKTLGAARKPLL